MNIALAIIFGLIVAVVSLPLGAFWVPTVVLYIIGRRWLTQRARKLSAEAIVPASTLRLWFRCIWGWAWRSALIYLLPFGILAMISGGNDPRLMGMALAKVIVGWMLTGLFSLDAPIWPLREVQRGGGSGPSEEIYDQIAEEFRTNSCDQGLLLKSLSMAGGDRDKATALYTAERATLLAAERARDHRKAAPVTTPAGSVAALIIVGIIIFWIWLVLTDAGQKPLNEVAQRYLSHSPSVPSEQTPASNALSPPPGNTSDTTAVPSTIPQGGQAWENSLGMKFVPAGTPGLLFSVFDTRVQDFEAFVNATGYNATGGMDSEGANGQFGDHGDTWKSPGFTQGPTSPVVGVSWNDAKAFCQWLTDKERREGKLAPSQSYRLPTDAEWSRAVGLVESAEGSPLIKGGMIKDVYPWGTQWPPPPGSGNFADSAEKQKYPSEQVIDGYDDGYANTSPVGSFLPNSYGLYDMGGNVLQWCEDLENPGFSTSRVLRGSSWHEKDQAGLLSSFRRNDSPDTRGDDEGFRCVLVGAPLGNTQ